MRGLEKKLLPLFSEQKTKQKGRACKSFAIPLCKQANKNKRTGKGVGTDFFPVHVTFSNYELLTRASNQFILSISTLFLRQIPFSCWKGKTQEIFTLIICHFII